MRVTVRRLPSMKMKRICGLVLCFGVIYVTTASIIATRIASIITGDGDYTDKSTLRQVHVIFRHGDRTPIERYPKDPYNSRKYWPEGWGKLTTVGKLMHYQLGQHIRARYNGFLSNVYTSEEIFVQSSDKDRTIQSAMANLAGMWPPVPGNQKMGGHDIPQFVPIHTVSEALDNKLAFSASCPKYESLSSGIPNIPSEKAFDEDHKNLYNYLSNNSGLNIVTYRNASDLYDILFVQTRHNLTLPKWTDEVFPDKLKNLSERWLKGTFFNNEMLRLHSGPLITEIARSMKRVNAETTELEKKILDGLFKVPEAKLYVYSAHDTTVAPMLEILGVFDGHYPPYASSLYLELHNEIPGNESTAYVKVFYRPHYDQPSHEVILPNCKSSPCKFEDFFESVQPWIIDEKQWSQECKL